MKSLLLCATILSATITTTAQVEWALDELFPDSIKTFVVSQRGEHLLNSTYGFNSPKLVVGNEEEPERRACISCLFRLRKGKARLSVLSSPGEAHFFRASIPPQM